MYVMGTAGHVDHGKSSLVLALSGIDPDRLPEEKARGLTIDLGFAWMTTKSGQKLGIVDVPGHERFVKNMIAGVGAIDFVLFVIAADDGWMPQTAEHLAILQYLNVTRGIIAVTKKDLAEPDWLSLVIDDAREKLSSTPFADAPIIAVDSISGTGIDEIKNAIDTMVESLPSRPDIGKPRLFIDRAFAMAGRGGVVTGTLLEGALETGQNVVIVPANLRARVRELQVHGQSVTKAPPGQRVAVNLAGVELGELSRGQCIVAEDDTETIDRIWAEVEILAEVTHPLKAERRVLVMVGSAEPEGIAYPIDPAGIAPGQRGICEIRLLSPLKARLRDRFVLRWPTPGVTIGGGVLLDVGGTRHTKRAPGFAARMERRLQGALGVFRDTELRKDGYASSKGFLQHSPFSESEIEADLNEAADRGEVFRSGPLVIHPDWFAEVKVRLLDILSELHKTQPHLAGLNLAEWTKRGQVAEEPMVQVVRLLENEGAASRSGEAYHLPAHNPGLPAKWAADGDRLWASIESGGIQPPTRPELETAAPNAKQIVAFWVASKRLTVLGDGVLFPASVFNTIRDRVVDHLKKSKQMSAAELRDLLGTTRKYAVPILEALDREGITRRVGDLRVLADAPEE
jgi:selenocysteine-specific elongation factor